MLKHQAGGHDLSSQALLEARDKIMAQQNIIIQKDKQIIAIHESSKVTNIQI